MLDMLYGDPQAPMRTRGAAHVARYGSKQSASGAISTRLLDALQLLLQDNIHGEGGGVMPLAHTSARCGASEMRLTYCCNNRCTFCYADAPRRGKDVAEMTTTRSNSSSTQSDEGTVPTLSSPGRPHPARRSAGADRLWRARTCA